MDNVITRSINWNGQKLELEVGKIARQADSAIVVKNGDTVVLCTTTTNKNADLIPDFLALTVHYQEKFYAAGRIPGGFIKRESRPSEHEVLTSRLIDRPLRPLFPSGFHTSMQVMCQVLSYSEEDIDTEILSLIGASASILLAGLPIAAPIAAAKVGQKDGQFVLNPSKSILKSGGIDLCLAATEQSIMMVESEASELPADKMLDALAFGHQFIKPVTQFVSEFVEDVRKEYDSMGRYCIDYTETLALIDKQKNNISDIASTINAKHADQISALQQHDLSIDRQDALRTEITNSFSQEEYDPSDVTKAIDSCIANTMRSTILDASKRGDGRQLDEIRDIHCEVDVLPRTHGSALFTRGNSKSFNETRTQSLAAITIGVNQDAQMHENLSGMTSDKVMLHYNFPAYSVGDASPPKAPGRREVGHGKLALKAVNGVMPTGSNFPYVVRIVSEITESNGSSSMATVCSASLALMNSGIPISRHVAGIAMGLVKDGDKFAVLSDISAKEDYVGDMDFKVAATEKGITALQMDIKIDGITIEIMKTALHQATKGTARILEIMSKTISTHNNELSEHAPRIKVMHIDPKKIKDIIGPGGKVIKDICDSCQAKIDVSDDGKVTIASANMEMLDAAVARIKSSTLTPEINKIYQGTVVKIKDFGAFVRILPNVEGLVHISQIMDARIDDINDHLAEDDEVTVKILDIDPRTKKIRLTMRDLLADNGNDLDADHNNDDSGRNNKNSNKRKFNNESEARDDDDKDTATQKRRRFF